MKLSIKPDGKKKSYSTKKNGENKDEGNFIHLDEVELKHCKHKNIHNVVADIQVDENETEACTQQTDKQDCEQTETQQAELKENDSCEDKNESAADECDNVEKESAEDLKSECCLEEEKQEVVCDQAESIEVSENGTSCSKEARSSKDDKSSVVSQSSCAKKEKGTREQEKECCDEKDQADVEETNQSCQASGGQHDTSAAEENKPAEECPKHETAEEDTDSTESPVYEEIPENSHFYHVLEELMDEMKARACAHEARCQRKAAKEQGKDNEKVCDEGEEYEDIVIKETEYLVCVAKPAVVESEEEEQTEECEDKHEEEQNEPSEECQTSTESAETVIEQKSEESKDTGSAECAEDKETNSEEAEQHSDKDECEKTDEPEEEQQTADEEQKSTTGEEQKPAKDAETQETGVCEAQQSVIDGEQQSTGAEEQQAAATEEQQSVVEEDQNSATANQCEVESSVADANESDKAEHSYQESHSTTQKTQTEKVVTKHHQEYASKLSTVIVKTSIVEVTSSREANVNATPPQSPSLLSPTSSLRLGPTPFGATGSYKPVGKMNFRPSPPPNKPKAPQASPTPSAPSSVCPPSEKSRKSEASEEVTPDDSVSQVSSSIIPDKSLTVCAEVGSSLPGTVTECQEENGAEEQSAANECKSESKAESVKSAAVEQDDAEECAPAEQPEAAEECTPAEEDKESSVKEESAASDVCSAHQANEKISEVEKESDDKVQSAESSVCDGSVHRSDVLNSVKVSFIHQFNQFFFVIFFLYWLSNYSKEERQLRIGR